MSVHIIAWYNMGNADFICHTNLSMSQFTIVLFLIWSEKFEAFPRVLVPLFQRIYPWPYVDPVSEGD